MLNVESDLSFNRVFNWIDGHSDLCDDVLLSICISFVESFFFILGCQTLGFSRSIMINYDYDIYSAMQAHLS